MRRFIWIIFVFSFFAATAPATGQQRTPATPDTTARADTVRQGISPGKAFFRSVLIPGWGQLSVHANTRAAAFITLQSASWFMLVKTLNKVADAKSFVDARVAIGSDSVRALMARDTMVNRILADPDSFRFRVEAQDTVVAIRSLISSREEQRQDWITYTLFLTLASGVDAFVAAHLADFPVITTTRRRDKAYEMKFTVPFPRRR